MGSFLFSRASIRTIHVYNGTTCLRSFVQTNSGRTLSSLFSVFICLYSILYFSFSLFLSLFPCTLYFHRFFMIPFSHFSSSSSVLHLSPVRIPARLFPFHPPSLFILSVSIVRTTINKPLIGLTPISGALFEVNEKPVVPRSSAFFNVSSFPSSYLHRPFLAICHCRSLKCGLMTIYHLCYSRKSCSKRRYIWVYAHNIYEVHERNYLIRFKLSEAYNIYYR